MSSISEDSTAQISYISITQVIIGIGKIHLGSKFKGLLRSKEVSISSFLSYEMSTSVIGGMYGGNQAYVYIHPSVIPVV